jgi:predicted DNA-binding transcriptional regulator YafY
MPKEIICRLERIDLLIRLKATGSPIALSSKLGISERCLYNYIRLLKDMGAPIRFCRYRNTYYYDKKGGFKFSFLMEN